MLPVLTAGMILMLLLILALHGRKMKELERENEILQSYMDTVEEFYQGIQSRIEASRRYRHDLAKHIQTLERLLENQKESEEIQVYMEGLKDEYEELGRQRFCRDEIVETILYIKNMQCEEEKIPTEIHVEDRFYKEVEEADMVKLLYNLLDNAIEANHRIKEGETRGIRFLMEKKGEKILIELENYISSEEEFSFATKKDKKADHGIGNEIISSIIDKYHGTRNIEIDKKNNLVTDKIMLLEAE